MADYSLGVDEYVVLKSTNVYKSEGGFFDHVGNDELMLTNKAIVLLKKGFTGKTKNFESFPLATVKVFNNQAQANFGKVNDFYPALEVFFLNGQATFVFQHKSEVLKWISAINKLLTGNDTVPSNASNTIMAIPGAETVAAAVAGTVDVFKNAFGKRKQEAAKTVSAKCPSCAGSVQGREGSIATCPYCGTHINL